MFRDENEEFLWQHMLVLGRYTVDFDHMYINARGYSSVEIRRLDAGLWVRRAHSDGWTAIAYNQQESIESMYVDYLAEKHIL